MIVILVIFIKVDLRCPDNRKENTKSFPVCPENKVIPIDEDKDYMKQIKPKNYTKAKNLICDWSDKKNYLIHFRMSKLFAGHGMVVEKFHEIFSFKRSEWLEKYINFNTQKRKKSNNEFEKDFCKLLNNAFYGKRMENVRNRIRLQLFKKDDIKNINKQQSKLTSN